MRQSFPARNLEELTSETVHYGQTTGSAGAFVRHQAQDIVSREAHPQVKLGKTGKNRPRPVVKPLECKGCGRCIIAC